MPVASIASRTLQNVRKRYERLAQEDAVRTIFAFLVTFSRACRFPDAQNELRASGIHLPDQPSLLLVVEAAKECIPPHELTSEHGQLAFAAAADALGLWYKQNAPAQLQLFKPTSEFLDLSRGLGTGSGFSELARLFFAKMTERHINYFLDRIASASVPTVQQRERFQIEIASHIDDVSRHAFETAKITQSFAAGWFNGHAIDKLPDNKEIEGFLAIAFGKLRDELRREEEAE
jgi:hypothetical protein